MYAITATVTIRTPSGFENTRQVPTFYLDENVHGILNENHARLVARTIINPAGNEMDMNVHALYMGGDDPLTEAKRRHPSSGGPTLDMHAEPDDEFFTQPAPILFPTFIHV